MSGVTLAFVIPTRNRASMAITAVRTLQRQQNCDLQIFVSDNSSHEEEVRQLSEFCRTLGDPRVTYMRTTGDLSQGQHWDWAIRQAAARSPRATHFTIHYDRKIMRPGAAATLAEVAARFPNKVFTYLADFSSHDPAPLRFWQIAWTGKLYDVPTARIVGVTVRGDAAAVGQALPILSNCFVPRAIIDTIVARFGTLCVSTTADSCFMYRLCAVDDSYLHFDRPLCILYASHRSAGLGYLKGGGGDFADYRRTVGGDEWLGAAPIPEVNLGYNMLFHEYELVRRAVGGDVFPPLDRAGYLRDLAAGLFWIGDDGMRTQLRALLVKEGWDGVLPPWAPRVDATSRLRKLYRKLHCRLLLFLADHFGTELQHICGFEFPDDETAVRYGLKYPRRASTDAPHLAYLDASEATAP